MRSLVMITTLVMLAGRVCADAQSPAAEVAATQPAAVFLAATQAYQQGQYEEALAHYRRLLQQHPHAAVLHYNRGNALYRAGMPGKAILSYRRAEWLAPRDPDLAANLRFVRAATGALPTEEGLLLRWLRRLALFEWIMLGTAAYLLITLCGALYLLGYRRRGCARVLKAAAGLGLLALAGGAAWGALLIRPEAVILEAVTARYAPLPDAVEYFALPPGTVVRIRQAEKDWVRIRHGKRQGWIPAAGGRRVHPAAGPGD